MLNDHGKLFDMIFRKGINVFLIKDYKFNKLLK